MRRLRVVWRPLACFVSLLAATGVSSGAVPLMTGLGTPHFAGTARSPLAQKYFDQGFRLCYAFNHDEAIRAFREAARLDPSCAMAHWGIALALGPNVNFPVDQDREKEAFAEVHKSRTLAAKGTPRERAWIEALAKRYSDDPKAVLHALDQAFTAPKQDPTAKYHTDLESPTNYATRLLA